MHRSLLIKPESSSQLLKALTTPQQLRTRDNNSAARHLGNGLHAVLSVAGTDCKQSTVYTSHMKDAQCMIHCGKKFADSFGTLQCKGTKILDHPCMTT